MNLRVPKGYKVETTQDGNRNIYCGKLLIGRGVPDYPKSIVQKIIDTHVLVSALQAIEMCDNQDAADCARQALKDAGY